MEVEIFDRETILDLMVNFIPLGILFFFIATFMLYDPWGFDPRFSGLMLTIMGGMFVALAVLTYLSGKAIAGDEKRATVYPQGQAGLEGAKPIHEHDSDSETDIDGETTQTNATSAATESDAESTATEAETETDVKDENTDGADDESAPRAED